MTSASDVEWVELALSDADALSALHNAAFPTGEAWSKSAIEDLIRLDNTFALGARKSGTWVSFVIVQYAADQAEILTIATISTHRKQGYAQQLLNKAEPYLRAKGAQKWLLEVAADNHGAYAFYEKLGFKEDGRRPQYYKRLEGERVDAILMSRPMGGQGTR